MDLASIGEFGLIERIRSGQSLPSGVMGIGDDCAVIPRGDGLDTLVTTDLLLEDKHFILSDITPFQLGWKSASVNLSDIAAMGGTPVGSFLSIGLPNGLSAEWMDDFIAGYRKASGGCPLLGGDTTAADKLCINVGVLGECPHGKALLRSGAKPGDIIYVTGPLGDSGAGLKIILQGLKRDEDALKLIERHYLPNARLSEGLVLSGLEGVHSAMDISDGIASDLEHILKASGVGAEVDVTRLPISAELQRVSALYGWDTIALAVASGEDYELLFTASPEVKIPFENHYAIGRIVEGSGIVWKGTGEHFTGFRHF